MKRLNVFSGLGIFLILSTVAWSAVPKLINTQGVLRDGSGNPVPNASYSMTFRIYDAASGGTVLWSESLSVATIGGQFSVNLGSLTPIPDSIFKDTLRWLGTTVSLDPEMTPRQQLVAVGYAFRVSSVNGASGGTITSKVSIGPGHTNTGVDAFVAGANNQVTANYSAIGGGSLNNATNESSVISGGQQNTASGFASTVSGGASNTASNTYSNVGGGLYNTSSGSWSVVDGGQLNTATAEGAAVGGGGNNHARGRYSTVGGGGGAATDSNSAGGDWSTIGGGIHNTASGYVATVGGGSGNSASYDFATVGGGSNNTASSNTVTVGGGQSNTASNTFATVGGGSYNIASGAVATVSGGGFDTASGLVSTVGGGSNNTASGPYSTVPGGLYNNASGDYSFAAGRRAKANHLGSFVWADSSVDADFASTGTNQFLIRASGGVGIGTTTPSVAGGTGLDILSSSGHGGIAFQGSGGSATKFALLSTTFGYLTFYDATNLADRFSISSSGNVGIGTTSPAKKLDVVGSIKTSDTLFASNVSSNSPLRLQTAGTTRMYFDDGSGGNVGIGTTTPAGKLEVAGQVFAQGFIQTSDMRLKKNVEPLTDILEKLQRIRSISFDWNETYEKMGRSSGRREIGVMAQDVEKMFPELVATWGDEHYRAVDYGKLSAVLLQAVKEQQKEIDELKTAIEKLRVERR